MSRQYPWFKLYDDSVDDDRIRLLDYSDRWHYIAIMCCKSKGIIDDPDQSAVIMQRRLAVRLGLPEDAMGDLKRRLVEVGLIDDCWQPCHWEDAQQRGGKDPTAVERKRRQRDKETSHADVTDTSQVTDQDAEGDVTPPEKEKDIDREVKTRKRKAPANKAHPMPDDFELTAARRDKFLRQAPHLSPEIEWAHFLEHHSAKGTVFANWDAAWGTWAMKAARFNPAKSDTSDQMSGNQAQEPRWLKEAT